MPSVEAVNAGRFAVEEFAGSISGKNRLKSTKERLFMNKKTDGHRTIGSVERVRQLVVYALIVLLMVNYTLVTILMKDYFVMKLMRDFLLLLLVILCLLNGRIKRFSGMIPIFVFVLMCGSAFLKANSLSLGLVFLRRYLFPLVLFAVIMQMDMGDKVKQLSRFALILFAILCAWGIFQAHVLGDTFLMKIGYPSHYAQHYGRRIIANSYYFGGFGIQRVVSTLCNPNVFALILGSTLIFVFFGFFRFSNKKLAAVLLAVIAAGYILTVSRSNFLAMGVVIVLFALPYIPHKKYLFIGIGIIAAVFVVVGLIQGQDSLLFRLFEFVLDSFSFSEGSAAGRPERWSAALEGISQNPFGVGLGHVGALAWEAGVRDVYYSCENSYFALMLDTGWLGAAAYIAFVGIQVVQMKRYAKVFRKNGDVANEKLCMSGVVITAYFLLVFLFSNHVHDMEAMSVIYVYIALVLSAAKKNLPVETTQKSSKSGGVLGKILGKGRTVFKNFCIAVRSLFWRRRRDTVLFGAWFGDKFADNSRFLYQYLAENKEKLGLRHVVWVTRNEKIREMLKDMGYEVYRMDTAEAVHFHKTAFMHVICNSATDRNGSVPDIDIRYSFGAKRVNLWHGVGVVKGVGCASKEYQRRKESNKLAYAIKESLERIRLYRQFVTGTGGWGDFFFLSPTEADTKQFEKFSYIPRKNFIESQYPRTCPCVRLTPREQEVLEYMKKYDKAVMYLPTFRTGDGAFDFSNTAEQLEDILKRENVLWVQKAHSASRTTLTREVQGHILNLDPSFDISVLMPHITLLVTDYSSAASDARFFHKPVLFYVPDLEAYMNGDNGVTPEAEELMRGPQLRNMQDLRDALIKAVRDPESAKPEDYEDIRLKYWGEEKDYLQIWNEICKAVGK